MYFRPLHRILQGSLGLGLGYFRALHGILQGTSISHICYGIVYGMCMQVLLIQLHTMHVMHAMHCTSTMQVLLIQLHMPRRTLYIDT